MAQPTPLLICCNQSPGQILQSHNHLKFEETVAPPPEISHHYHKVSKKNSVQNLVICMLTSNVVMDKSRNYGNEMNGKLFKNEVFTQNLSLS